MMRSFLFAAVFIANLVCLFGADPFSVTIRQGAVKCFGDQVTVGLRVQANITSDQQEFEPKAQIRLYDGSGSEILMMEDKYEYFFDQTMRIEGNFQVCIFQTGQRDGIYNIDIKMGAQIADKDQDFLKKDDAKQVEKLVRRWERMLKTIRMNLNLIVKKADEKIEEADYVSTLVKLFSFVSIIIYVTVAYAVTVFMKSFFKKKKII